MAPVNRHEEKHTRKEIFFPAIIACGGEEAQGK